MRRNWKRCARCWRRRGKRGLCGVPLITRFAGASVRWCASNFQFEPCHFAEGETACSLCEQTAPARGIGLIRRGLRRVQLVMFPPHHPLRGSFPQGEAGETAVYTSWVFSVGVTIGHPSSGGLVRETGRAENIRPCNAPSKEPHPSKPWHPPCHGGLSSNPKLEKSTPDRVKRGQITGFLRGLAP